MNRFTAIAGACALALAAFGAAPAAAQDQQVTPTIVVAKDKSAAFRLEYPASEIVVAQPEIAALVATTDRSFYIRGKAQGVTNLLVYDKQRRLAQVIDVRVGHDVDSIQQDVNAALPDETIKVSNFANGVLLTGDASNSLAANRAMAIADRYAPKAVVSELNIRNAEQVMVEVRVMEATKHRAEGPGLQHLRRERRRRLLAQYRLGPDQRPGAGGHHRGRRHDRRRAHRRGHPGAGDQGRHPHPGQAEPDGDVGRGGHLPGRRRVPLSDPHRPEPDRHRVQALRREAELQARGPAQRHRSA